MIDFGFGNSVAMRTERYERCAKCDKVYAIEYDCYDDGLCPECEYEKEQQNNKQKEDDNELL